MNAVKSLVWNISQLQNTRVLRHDVGLGYITVQGMYKAPLNAW